MLLLWQGGTCAHGIGGGDGGCEVGYDGEDGDEDEGEGEGEGDDGSFSAFREVVRGEVNEWAHAVGQLQNRRMSVGDMDRQASRSIIAKRVMVWYSAGE